ncbi:MAG: gliding motility-associated C-terminal domain-containing protein [Flavobacteriales bacterium]|nr:gliding motility-associated C-terminal domain-containing protein [Flavobacteriales bacterium]
MKNKSSFILVLFVLFTAFALSSTAENKPKFIENKGQFPKQVEYKLRLANADIFFEKDQLVFNFYNPELVHTHDEVDDTHSDLAGHAYNVRFEGSNPNVDVDFRGEAYPERINYIRKNLNVSGVGSSTELYYDELYEGIDLHYYGVEGRFKYDVILASHADPSVMKMTYEGQDALKLKNGNLIVTNTFNQVVERIPLAYQVINGKKTQVACEYRLHGKTVSFDFPEGYDQTKELIIDPELIFSSYTGSESNNFGFTATYDEDGALYGGGIVFGGDYPETPGAYTDVFSGVVDMAISKFEPNGTFLEYSTYIGGESCDAPHSMIVNSQGQLVILGSTSSTTFPTSANAYDTDFNGGTAVNYTSNGTNFQNGSDIVVVILSADGSSLIGSTYLGGSLNDGLNENTTLSYNYGDIFRGEVIVDPQDNIYIASSTVSSDFPVSTGAIDQTLGGTQDACLAKFNPDVSVLEWCTYVGGSAADAGYSMKLNVAGDVYLAGGTSSQDLTVDAGALFGAFQGGSADGFLYRFSNDGTTLINSTYIGTSSYDQTYFVEVDDHDDVYTYGQSAGNYPVTSGTYSNNNGKQFIQKLTPDLSASIYSTVFGSGSSAVNISPTAFLVDICERVFVSGWGGGTNNSWNSATGNTAGLPVTSDGEQQTTDGSDFYFMVLEADATALLYGSYFGGNGIQEHVDGGTSRFNDNGVIHQAACAGCGGSDLFPTQPGVVSQVNGNSCNLGVVKLDLEISAVQVEIAGSGTEQGCVPFAVQFESDLVNATEFLWYFGDGDTSSLPNPGHIYVQPGVYEVMLIGTDTAFCTGEVFTDTAFVTVTVSLLTDAAEAGTGDHLCPDESAILGETEIAGFTYEWTPTTGLSNPSAAQPTATPEEDTQYFLTITNPDNCQDTDSVLVTVFGVSAFPDTTICTNDSIQVTAVGGATYSWLPVDGVSNPSSPNPYITAGYANVYTVTASDGTCEDTANVVLQAIPAPTALFDVEISQSCQGDSVKFINLTDGADQYTWNIGGMIETSEYEPVILFEPGEGPIVSLTAINSNGECADSVTVDFSNGWFSEDSVLFRYPNIITPNGDGINDCFKPEFEGDLDECYTLKVFNRWGRLLYDSEKHGGNCWDGTQRTDDPVYEGTYYFIANVRGEDKAGYLTVIY